MKRFATLVFAFLLALRLTAQEQDRAELMKRLELHVVFLASDSLKDED